jgi:hypothetical protein
MPRRYGPAEFISRGAATRSDRLRRETVATKAYSS